MNFKILVKLVVLIGISANCIASEEVSNLVASAQDAFMHTNFDLAIDRCNKLLKVNDADVNYADAYLIRGVAYQGNKDYGKAMLDFDESIQIKPGANAYEARGKLFSLKKDHAKAIEDYSEAIKFTPKDANLYSHRATEYFIEGRDDAALIDYSMVILLTSDDIRRSDLLQDAYATRGTLYLKKIEFAPAVKDFDRAILLKTNDYMSYLGRGMACFALGEYGKATNDYRNTIRIAPAHSQSYDCLGWLQAACPEEKFRNGHDALINAKKACDLTSWQHSSYLQTVAAAYAEKGDFENAVKWQEKYIASGLAFQKVVGAQRVLDLFKKKKPYREKSVLATERN